MKRKSEKIIEFVGRASSEKLTSEAQDAASASSIAMLFKRIERKRKYAL